MAFRQGHAHALESIGDAADRHLDRIHAARRRAHAAAHVDRHRMAAIYGMRAGRDESQHRALGVRADTALVA